MAIENVTRYENVENENVENVVASICFCYINVTTLGLLEEEDFPNS